MGLGPRPSSIPSLGRSCRPSTGPPPAPTTFPQDSIPRCLDLGSPTSFLEPQGSSRVSGCSIATRVTEVWAPATEALMAAATEHLAGTLPSGPVVKHEPSVLTPQVDGILKTVLRDEIIAWHKKTQEDTSSPLSAAGQPENMDSQQLVSLVQKAVTAIMTRLHNLAQFEGGESKVNTLVAAANSLDNLCRMDPAWHPWL